MNMEILTEKAVLKELVDTFSNLADEKRVGEQMSLFTPNAHVVTYIGGKLFADTKGADEIKKVFSDFLSNFHTVYHLNGQQTVQILEDKAEGVNYCQATLIGDVGGEETIIVYGVRYNDSYVKIDGKWLIEKRIANFMTSDIRRLER